MRFATCTLFAGISLFATASVCESMLLQGGALAILGWAVWYLLAKAFPGERKAFLEAQKSERHDFLRAQENTRHEFKESLQTLAHSLDCLTAALHGSFPDKS